MLVAAVIGLLGSGTAALIMRLELTGFAARGAFLDVLGDTIGSIAAIVAALLVIATGCEYADPLASLAIVILVVPRALLLLRDAMTPARRHERAHGVHAARPLVAGRARPDPGGSGCGRRA